MLILLTDISSSWLFVQNLILIVSVVFNCLELIKLLLERKILYQILQIELFLQQLEQQYFAPVAAKIIQFAYHARIILISQLIKVISGVLLKQFKYFNFGAASTSSV